MTYVQFKNLIEGIGRKLHWDLKMALVSSPAGAEVKEEDYPLFSKSNDERVFRMSDALALQKVAQSS